MLPSATLDVRRRNKTEKCRFWRLVGPETGQGTIWRDEMVSSAEENGPTVILQQSEG